MNGRTPTAEEKVWLQASKELGCMACIVSRLAAPWETPTEYTANHHIDGTRIPGAHLLSFGLCAQHHQHGPDARHVNKKVFESKFGTELYLLACARAYVKQKKGSAWVPSLP